MASLIPLLREAPISFEKDLNKLREILNILSYQRKSFGALSAFFLVILENNKELRECFMKAWKEEVKKSDFIDKLNDKYSQLKEVITPKSL